MFKVLYGEVPEWDRNIDTALDNPDLEEDGTFESHEDAYYHVAAVLEARLNEIGYELYRERSDGEIWCDEDDGHSRMIGYLYESEGSIEDTDEWWAIVEN